MTLRFPDVSARCGVKELGGVLSRAAPDPLVHSVSIGSGGGIVLWPLYARPQSMHTCGSVAGRLVYHVAWPGRMGITNRLHANLALNLHTPYHTR
jgi:hypothetical protein